jgi:hypothetical protein
LCQKPRSIPGDKNILNTVRANNVIIENLISQTQLVYTVLASPISLSWLHSMEKRVWDFGQCSSFNYCLSESDYIKPFVINELDYFE